MKCIFNQPDNPITIHLSEKKCSCGNKVGGRSIRIQQFAEFDFKLTQRTVDIWKNKSCWKCKAKPVVDQEWSMSINVGERNRLFCPDCTEFIKKQLPPLPINRSVES